MRARILIGTPVYDEQVLTSYHRSILNLLNRFRSRAPDVTFDSALPSGSLITTSRNALASIVLERPVYTHLLFIDADMGFSPEAVEKMLAFDKPVVACAYPRRKQSHQRVLEVARTVQEPEENRSIALDYIGGTEDWLAGEDQRPIIRGSFARARRAGTGLMLIRRDALEKLRAVFPQLVVEDDVPAYRDLGVTGPVFQPFEPVQNRSGLFVGEDFAFCARWIQGCGGEIWTCFDETVEHVGREKFTGAYAARLRYEGLL